MSSRSKKRECFFDQLSYYFSPPPEYRNNRGPQDSVALYSILVLFPSSAAFVQATIKINMLGEFRVPNFILHKPISIR